MWYRIFTFPVFVILGKNMFHLLIEFLQYIIYLSSDSTN